MSGFMKSGSVGGVPGARGLRQLAVALTLVVFPASCLVAPAVAGQEPSSPREGKSSAGAYVLERGDTLEIRVFNVSQLDQTVTIGPDGRFSIILLDEVEAAGLTTAKLDEMITARYAAFYRDPRVTINVKAYVNQKVYIAGEVVQPGLFPLVGEMTAARAVIQAGGLKASAKAGGAVLVRNQGGVPTVRRIDLDHMMRGKEPDISLMPFDVVYVPRSKIARIDDFVNQYIKQVVPFTLTGSFSYLLNGQLVSTAR